MNKRSLFQILIVLLLIVSLSSCAGNAGQEPTVAVVRPIASPTTPDERLVSPAPLTNTTTSLITEEQTLIDLYANVNPSVVNVQIVANLDAAGSGNDSTQPAPNFPEIPGFPNLPDLQPFNPGPQHGLGSGFVYDTDGHIITNNHVVNGADKVTVTFSDNTEVEATVVGVDPDSDLAVIEVDIDPALLHPIPLGESDTLQVGQFVVTIGNPFGLDGSMTTGIVSGLGRQLPSGAVTPSGQAFTIPDIIQTDAAMNPGNSGGPLLNLQGELIGVNTAIATNNGTFSGIGYAVPVDTVKQVAPELIRNGRIEHPWLGISGSTLDRDIAQEMGLDPDQHGILIAEVVADSPADKSSLHGSDTTTAIDGLDARIGGDIIVGIDGQAINEFDELLTYIVNDTKVGQTVTLDVLRDGNPQEVTVTLEARPQNNN